MWSIYSVTLRGIWRDKVLQGMLLVALGMLLVPVISPMSMRQVTQLSVTLSLSLVGFLQFLVTVFIGGTLLWRDIDRRYLYAVLGLPVSRASYLFGRYFGFITFLTILTLVLGGLAVGMIVVVGTIYPPAKALNLVTLLTALGLGALKFMLLTAFSMLLCSVSTSFFLPIFGTFACYFMGHASQQVYDYLTLGSGALVPPAVQWAAKLFYYAVPNFSAFDYTIAATYGLPVNPAEIGWVLLYFLIYTGILLILSVLCFNRREMQ